MLLVGAPAWRKDLLKLHLECSEFLRNKAWFAADVSDQCIGSIFECVVLFVFETFTLKDGTDTIFRNVGSSNSASEDPNYTATKPQISICISVTFKTRFRFVYLEV